MTIKDWREYYYLVSMSFIAVAGLLGGVVIGGSPYLT